MRILIVEDSPLVQNMYRLVFSPRRHELVTARDGHAALDLLGGAETPFDLILLDLRMPDMDGVEFLREAHRRGQLGAIPVVLTTMEPDSSTLLSEAKALGVSAVVKKPWRPQQLRDVVEAIVR